MKAHHLARSAALAALFSLGTAGIAHAQATRTWVSGVGDDTNPCSRTAPCETLAVALTKTAAGGMISVLDPGEFGAVTITKAITIDGSPDRGAVSSTLGAIVVDAGANDRVVVRAFRLAGTGGGAGIAFKNGKSLHLDRVRVTGFASGIDVQHTTGGALFLSDVVATANTNAGLGASTIAGTLLGSITRSYFSGNGTGVLAGAGARLSFFESDITQNTTGVSTTADGADVNLEQVELSANVTGIHVTGTGLVRASRVLATANETSTLTQNGGAVRSFGNNRLDPLSTIALASTSTSAGAAAGTAVTYEVATTTTGFFASPVVFSCTGLPTGASCAFAPGLPDGTGSAAVNVTVTSTAAKTAWNLPGPSRSPVAFGGLFLLPFVVAFGRKKKGLRMPLFFLALVSLVGSVTACGDDDDNATVSIPDAGKKEFDAGADTDVTPPGSYPIQVLATSGAASGTLDLTLVVQ